MDFFRGRRLRSTSTLRSMVAETGLSARDLIQPYFVAETGEADFARPISSMPGQYQLGIPKLVERAGAAHAKGLPAVILFGLPREKDDLASGAYAEDGVVQQAVARLKDAHPDLCVITDVCLCEYTSHGHCGLVAEERILNDPTVDLLARTAVSHARAGADMVAPSDMMDGRVEAIREALDDEGFVNTPIMSYAVKYASSFYGPFREAAESPPAFGDRKTHQMDPANAREAMREAEADVLEGADILMVKPAVPYLDVIRALKTRTNHTLAAYHVSGEYAMIKAAAANGWIDEKAAVLETLTSIKRAGADLILTYHAEAALDWLAG
jgi:porphobilinogen synthase